MKNFLFYAFCFFLFIACTNDSDNLPCTADEEWLQDFKDQVSETCCENCACVQKIFKGNYKGRTVYYQRPAGELCDAVYFLKFYNCTGDVVKEMSQQETYDYLIEGGREDEVVFSCPETGIFLIIQVTYLEELFF